MSKRSIAKRSRPTARKVGRRKAVIVTGLLLSLILAGTVFAEWGSLFGAQKQRVSSRTAAPSESPTPMSLAPASPSKEYVYAGGRLIATEEPAGSQQVPPTPQNLSATPGNTQVSLSWSPSSGATSYNVKRSTTNGGPYTTIAPGVTSTSYLDTGRTNGVTYYYVVSAVNGAGESPNSAPASATPSANPTINLALNKPASQSSTPILAACGTTAPASLAVDGNTNGSLANCSNYSVTHTNLDSNAWWQVDLGAVQSVQNIQIYNRTDCCPERLSSYYVFVSDAAFTSTDLNTTINQAGVSNYFQTAQAGSPTTVTVNRTGRYVRVQLSGTNYLHMAEVQVWGTASSSPINIALNRPATQSSTPILAACGTTAPASLAVDGNTNGSLASCSGYSVTHTDFDTNAWWQVDLGSIQSIQTVQIFNRTDCCASRLSNYYVFVSDVAFTSTNLNTTLNQTGVSNYFQAAQAGSPTTITVNRTGRYVRVQLSTTDYLHMAEVQVWH
jgi:F5/8 type C domain/Fibronectin type III domain